MPVKETPSREEASLEARICCPPITDSPLSQTDAEGLAAVFTALGDPVRLRLLSMVAAAGEICSCDLEDPLGRSQPTISHHTRVLSEVGLISGERRGRWTWWRVNEDRLGELRQALGTP
jgi:ArsR family transcriptional regulator, arsenate/arsenite/antimonite-responsive transcriptional repressor